MLPQLIRLLKKVLCLFLTASHLTVGKQLQLPVERRLLKGMLQLQLHDPGMIVHFKDVRLKVLD